MSKMFRLVASALLVSCHRAPAPSLVAPADTAADEQAIRAIIRQFPNVRDVDAEASIYSPDAWFLSARTPEPLRGRDARRADIAKRRAPAPGEVTVIEPERVVVAAAGDMAYDYGTYRTTWTESAQPREVHGYYLRAWRKIDGKWLSAAESVQRRPLTAEPSVSESHGRSGPHGRIISANEGTSLKFCTSPGLSVNIKVDSAAVGTTRFAMGTAAISPRGSNAGAHDDVDEAVYFLSGRGRAFVGADTVAADRGVVLYVPQGTRHGFISTGDEPLEFLWVIAPQGLTERFRARGVSLSSVCPP